MVAPKRASFVIVDGAGAVHGDVIDEAALHQVDEVAVDAGAQDVRAHHQDARRAGGFGGGEARGDGGQVGMRRTAAWGRSSASQRSRCKSCWRSASGFTSRRERSNCSYRLMVGK